MWIVEVGVSTWVDEVGSSMQWLKWGHLMWVVEVVLSTCVVEVVLSMQVMSV